MVPGFEDVCFLVGKDEVVGGGIGQRWGTWMPGLRKKRIGEAKGSNVWDGDGKSLVLRAWRVLIVQGDWVYNSEVKSWP